MPENIVLVGFMGVGKGQVGRALADITSRQVVDCDDLIESAVNMKVKKIFATYGEKEFRRRERQVALWLEKNVKKTIVSTGGGFVNVPNLKKIGKVIFLHAEFDFIIHRLKSHPNGLKKIKKRPLLQDLAAAEKLYNSRMPIYRREADLTIQVQDKSPEEIGNEIAAACGLIRGDN